MVREEVFLAVLFLTTAYSVSCPINCLCYKSTYFYTICSSREFTDIPVQIPVETEYIALANNKISSIHDNAFPSLPSLQSLSLYSNKISSIHPDAFFNLTSLHNIDLNSNKISSIHPDAFRNLTSLQTVHLSYNELSFIDPRVFRGLPSLNELYLQNNKLTTINPDMFIDLHALRFLYLYDNPLVCDCSIRRFRLWLFSKPYLGTTSARCSNGTYVTQLNDYANLCSGEVDLEAKCTKLGQTTECGPNAECQSIDGNLICKCTKGYFDDNFLQSGGICVPEKDSGFACSQEMDSVECVPNAECKKIGNLLGCTCSSGYYDSNFGLIGGKCIKVKSVGTDCDGIIDDRQCVQNAECMEYQGKFVCACSKGFMRNTMGNCTLVTEISEASGTHVQEKNGKETGLAITAISISIISIGVAVLAITLLVCQRLRGKQKTPTSKSTSCPETYANCDMGNINQVYDQLEVSGGCTNTRA